jgi:phosphoribosylglycinamide formyltransferase-1
MANLAVLASGRGSNFRAIAERLRTSRHDLVCLISDRREAGALDYARELGIDAYVVPYFEHQEPNSGRERLINRSGAEERMIEILEKRKVDLVALAGFMRVLSPRFVQAFEGRIVNVHPSLLPRFPGRDAIRRSFQSDAVEMGVSVHLVDEGVDSGVVLRAESFEKSLVRDIAEAEERIHSIEHRIFPDVILGMLDAETSQHNSGKGEEIGESSRTR